MLSLEVMWQDISVVLDGWHISLHDTTSGSDLFLQPTTTFKWHASWYRINWCRSSSSNINMSYLMVDISPYMTLRRVRTYVYQQLSSRCHHRSAKNCPNGYWYVFGGWHTFLHDTTSGSTVCLSPTTSNQCTRVISLNIIPTWYISDILRVHLMAGTISYMTQRRVRFCASHRLHTMIIWTII